MIFQTDSHDILIPPMMVQTIVENGIKHGISQLIQGGVIEIQTYLANHYLIISVRNNGQIHQNIDQLSSQRQWYRH
jgi:two-component system LytT family sensor kinase